MLNSIMSFFSGITIGFCILAQVNCSLFDLTQIINNENGKVQIRVGNPTAASIQEFWLSTEKLKKKQNQENSFEGCSSPSELCQTYTDGTQLKISHMNDECISVNYTTKAKNVVSLKASFDIRKGHIYGGPMNQKQGDLNWPAEESHFVDEPYMNIEADAKNSLFYQAILEPYWLFSTGHYIYVDNKVPLFITSNSSHMFELRAKNVAPYAKPSQPALALNFAVCQLDNTREAHEHAIRHFLGKPSKLQDLKGVTQPVWTTLVPLQLHESVDQAAVMYFAQKIIKCGYGGRLVIGHKWEQRFGSFQPNNTKFSNFTGLVSHIKSLNFTLDVRVHSFVSYRERRKLSKKDRGSLVETEVFDKFYKDHGNYIDPTNPDSLDFFHKKLVQLRETYGIDSFEFYGGNYGGLTGDNSRPNPVEMIIQGNSKSLARLNSNIITNMARGTQKYGFVVAIPSATDVQSHWRALRAVIPRLLHMNILGYSFTLSNIMGGNHHMDISREQYLRWVQLTVFTPSMQFSINRPPWSYDKEIIDLTKKFVNLHASYSSYIIELMEENVKTGAPVNPPIWWIAPDDLTALACKSVMYDSTTVDLPGHSICRSEFLLGEKILVAPVVVEGQTKRDIYLPTGYWLDGNSEMKINGPTWVKDYPAGLDVLPYFIRLQPHPFSNTTTDDKNSNTISWTCRIDLTHIVVILGIFLASIIIVAICVAPQLSKSVSMRYKTFK